MGIGLSMTIVMRNYLDRQITKFWIWLVTSDVRRDSSVTWQFQPGDEEQLIQSLIRMNDVLARAVRF